MHFPGLEISRDATKWKSWAENETFGCTWPKTETENAYHYIFLYSVQCNRVRFYRFNTMSGAFGLWATEQGVHTRSGTLGRKRSPHMRAEYWAVASLEAEPSEKLQNMLSECEKWSLNTEGRYFRLYFSLSEYSFLFWKFSPDNFRRSKLRCIPRN